MSTEIVIAAIAAGVAVLGACGSAGIAVFNAGAIKGRIDALTEKLAEAVAEMREVRLEKQKTAAHEIRIGMLEKTMVEVTRKVSTATMKAVRAEARSSPDLGGRRDD